MLFQRALITAQTPTRVSLIHRTEPTAKNGEKKKKLKSKTDKLRSIGKQSGESVESVLVTKRKATLGRICRKGRF